MSTGADGSADTALEAMDWDLSDLELPGDPSDPDRAAAAPEDDEETPTPGSVAPDSDGPPPTTKAPDDVPASATQTTAKAAPGAAPSPDTTADSVVPEGFTPPEGGVPFTFSLDGQEVAVEGLQLHGDHLVVSKEVWERQLMPKYLGNRAAWTEQVKQQRGREAQLQQQLEQERVRQSEETQRASVIMSKLAEIDRGGTDAWVQWLDNFAVNRPTLDAEVRAQMAERRAQALENQGQQARQAADQETLVPVAQNYLGDTLTQYLAQDQFKVLGADHAALNRELWEDHRDRLFFTADRDYPEAGLAKGQLGFNYDALTHILGRRAEQAQQVAAKISKLEKDAKANAAALEKHRRAATPPKTTTAATRAADPDRDWTDELLDEDWDDAFAS